MVQLSSDWNVNDNCMQAHLICNTMRIADNSYPQRATLLKLWQHPNEERICMSIAEECKAQETVNTVPEVPKMCQRTVCRLPTIRELDDRQAAVPHLKHLVTL